MLPRIRIYALGYEFSSHLSPLTDISWRQCFSTCCVEILCGSSVFGYHYDYPKSVQAFSAVMFSVEPGVLRSKFNLAGNHAKLGLF